MCRPPSGGCLRPACSAMNWSPRSTNAIEPLRPRSVSSPKMRSKKASASSMPPTSTATWLIPTGRGIGSSLASDVEADDRPAVVDDPDRTPADGQGERLKRIQPDGRRDDTVVGGLDLPDLRSPPDRVEERGELDLGSART